jgi:hypothetical protein
MLESYGRKVAFLHYENYKPETDPQGGGKPKYPF